MKLNYKRTVCVGFAFFLICAFWQAYDNIIPLILTNKFGMPQTVSGVIMALDNIFALFMLPLFGAVSDRTKSRMGRRTPYILFGTVVAVAAFVGLSVVDGMQLKQIGDYAKIDDPAVLERIYDETASEELLTPDGETFIPSHLFTKEEYKEIRSVTVENEKAVTNQDYTKYVVPARNAVVRRISSEHKGTLVIFIALLLIALISMATFRSPAVALMPDVTIKPLRSKANAVINLMGSAGGILVLVLGMVFATSAVRNSMMSYMTYFCVIAAVMIAALLIFMLTVREPRFAEEMEEESRRFGLDGPEKAEAAEHDGELQTENGRFAGRRLSAGQRRSLLFILASIVLWFAGYNAVTSKYSVYASTILHKDYNLTLIIAQAAAIISYLPVGIIASKIGRKKTILAGVVMLAAAFGTAAFMRAESPTALMNAMFALAGIAWATINVNSFPMVVEMCSAADVGKYTGFYYTASMAAQVMTPILSGYLMDRLGMTVLFPYAVIFVAAAFVTMLFVKHGDSKPEAKKGLEALEDSGID
ncbi:MAG: MFS transporter [Lachnospiraceae bacterium]|nr:MFS transporter [Lachnospiraceae bacterium]